ncbi:MAG: F0F1 ATP synthase subunit delta [Cyanothece sp. SIO1E1]|nr:F0F1 ATP synthase subunit delta [Cyanothece sp. SIO1E1]
MKGGMVTSEVLKPYAQALMDLAKDSQLADRLGADTKLLIELLESSEELGQFLANPLIKADIKKSVLRQLVGNDIHTYTLNFLMLLADRGRILFLGGICQQYQTLLRELNQTVLAEVTATIDLSDAQQDAIRQRVKDMTGAREVELSISLDPALIGGVIIKVGSQVVDASLRGQLRRIGMSLSSTS